MILCLCYLNPFLNQLGNKIDLKYYNLVQMFNVEIVDRCLWLSENLVFLS